MTLLEQATTQTWFQPTPSEFDEPVWHALHGVPHGLGVVITGPDPDLQVVLVHDAPPSDVELVEDSAARRMREVRNGFGRSIVLLVLSKEEAAGIKLPQDARARSLPR